MECVEVDWKRGKEDRLQGPVEKPGTGFRQDVDLVILAMGFTGPTPNRIVDDLGIQLNERGHIRADDSGMTSVEGIFTAGDMALGQSLVVKAIADGRRTARGIMAFLGEKKKIMKALLALEDGSIFKGRSFTGRFETEGEVVFNTSMTGYQEILTDPSYCGQMVTMDVPADR